MHVIKNWHFYIFWIGKKVIYLFCLLLDCKATFMNSSSRFTIVSRISLIPFCVAYIYIVPHIEIIHACGVMRSDKSCSLCSNLAWMNLWKLSLPKLLLIYQSVPICMHGWLQVQHVWLWSLILACLWKTFTLTGNRLHPWTALPVLVKQ